MRTTGARMAAGGAWRTIRAHALAVADWLLGIDEAEPEPVRKGRIGSMFQKRPALIMSSLAILLVSSTSAIVTGARWAMLWVLADLLLLSARLALSLRYDRPGREPPLAAMRLIAFGSCALFLLLTAGCSIAMATGLPMLMVMATVSVMGLSTGVTSLWAGVPRLAVTMLALTAFPFATAIGVGAGQPLVATQFIIIMLGTTAFVLQNHRKLVTTLHAEHRNGQRAGTDSLTGLASRGATLEALAAACAHGRGFALLYLDLDGFKEVNDAFGHGAGDQLLREQARRITAKLEGAAVVGRFGGDEFVVILTEADRDVAGIAARRLIEAVAAPVALDDGTPARVGVSVGVALSPADGRSADTLIGRADRALYAAKRAGRGCFRFHDSVAGAEAARLVG